MALVENNRFIVQVFVGALSAQYEALSVEASKQTSSEEIVSCIADKLDLHNAPGGTYELAEVVGDVVGGECKERRLGANESPVAVMLLWPNNTSGQYYRFYLREKMTDVLWMEDFSVDPQLIKDYFQRFLYQPKDREYPDLCQLPDLNELTLLDNLRARFHAGYIYTYVGSILIAVNPFKFHPIYNPKYVKLYQKNRIGSSLPPHIFAVADKAYHCMLKEKTNQCIVISGESGSGKTESTNFLLHHLTALSQKGSHGSGVEQTILSAGPVLEAFGNAKTAHNNNSSRFGKFIQVNYKENGMVHGAVVQKYLLEKSRICSQGRNERNYHVFYYLLAGASEQERDELHLLSSDKYNYLSRTDSYCVPGVDEKYEFSRLKQSMEMVGFTMDKQRRLFAVLSAVLLLGNVEFQPRKPYHHDEAVSVKNPETVTLISQLLRVKRETLLAALTAKRARASGETLVINYRLPEAVATRDAMAKCLYGALFDWIVMQVNHALLSKKDTLREHLGHSIGVLDIFGFEDFGLCNSFEQLCINYANEHLQYYFNQHVFKYEQEEYRREGIRWTDIGFSDNTGCLHLIEGKPGGLLCLLDDQCNFPGATSETLLQKFSSGHKDNNFYEKPQRREPAFIVRHYAGSVKYQVTNMREKNLDLMRQDIVGVLKNSSMAFVRELVGADPVAVFRWAIVRAFFRGYFAFHEAGRRHRVCRSDGVVRLPRPTVHAPNESIIRLGEYQTSWRSLAAHKSNNETNLTQQTDARQLTEVDQSGNQLMKHLRQGRGKLACEWQRTPIDGALDRVFKTSDSKDVMHRANQIVMKNKSFRPRDRAKKGLKNLQSVKTLAGRTGSSGGSAGANAGGAGKARKQPLTVAAQFQHSLHALMVTLNQANPFFIRCIKSNGEKIPNVFDDDTVQRQLRYTGMLETVRIRQAGYNVRLTYEEFIQLYRILLPKGLLSSQTDVRHFLATLNLNRDNYQLGGSKIFLRESEQTKLDYRLHQQIMASIITIQRWFRAVLQRRRFVALRKATIVIQLYCRQWIVQRLFAAIRVQAWFRGTRVRRWYVKLRSAVVAFQAAVRGRRVRLIIADMRKRHHHDDSRIKHAIEPKSAAAECVSTCAQTVTDRQADQHDQLLINRDRRPLVQEQEAETLLTLRATQSLPLSKQGLEKFQSTSILDGQTSHTYCKRKVTKTQNISELALRQKHTASEEPDASPTEESWQYGDDDVKFARCPPIRDFTTIHNSNKITTQDIANELIWLRLDQNYLNNDRNIIKLSQKETQQTCITKTEEYPNNSQHASQLAHDSHMVSYLATEWADGWRTEDDSDVQDSLQTHTTTSSRKSSPQLYQRSLSTTTLEPVSNARGLVSLPPVRRDPRLTDTQRREGKSVGNQSLVPATADRSKADVVHSAVPEPPVRSVRRTASELAKAKQLGSSSPSASVSTKRAGAVLGGGDLRRRNSDPAAAAVLALPHHQSSVEYIGAAGNGVFRIAGHRFRKSTRVGKADLCVYCHERIDAFVTQGQQCLDCKQLYHTKCIQNKGVITMPCAAPLSSHQQPKRKRGPAPNPELFSKQAAHSKFSLTGTSEFTDRTDKIISDAKELQNMQDFITKKIYKMESDKSNKQSEVDKVFKYALREFKDNLVATYSVVNKQGSSLKYKDLIANFQHVMQTVCQREGSEVKTFPLTMGVNAFRGFMDEFMNSRQDIEKTRTKRKKDKKRKVDDPIVFAGHTFILSMINIPTECEICKTFFMWPIERSLICQTCKLASHKKCYIKVTTPCRKDAQASVVGAVGALGVSGTARRGRIFGVPLFRLSAGDGKIPDVVDGLVTTIEQYGLYTEGIYRKSGVSSKVRELKRALDDFPEETISMLDKYQVHVLASVLKSFFRDMPEPLLTFDFYDDFIMAAELSDPQDRVSTLFAILKKLPKVNFDLMERLIFHLTRVALHEDTNRMGVNALSIVFAPCVLRTSKVQPAQVSLHDIARQTRCIETILIERLKTVRSTLADIATLDTACHTATHRLSSLRCSKVFCAEETEPQPILSSPLPTPPPRQEEEAILVGHIHDIQKEKEILTSALPSLTRATSDDDLLSTDLDGEYGSGRGSLDDLTQTPAAAAAPRAHRTVLHRQVSSDDPIMV